MQRHFSDHGQGIGGVGINYFLRFETDGKTFAQFFSFQVEAEREALRCCEEGIADNVECGPITSPQHFQEILETAQKNS